MTLTQIISVLIFVFILILIATEAIHRTYAALLGAGGMVIIGVVKPTELLHFIEVDILGVIIGMMLLVRGAEKSGIFRTIAVKIMRASRTPTSLAVILLSFTMILSMFLENITCMLVVGTITIIMTISLKIRPQLLLIFQAIITEIGGMMFIMSSIPNIIVALEGGLTFYSFVRNILPLGIILFVVTVLIFIRIFKRETEKEFTHALVEAGSRGAIEPSESPGDELDVRGELRTMEFREWVDLSMRDFGSDEGVGRQLIAAVIMAGTIIGFVLSDPLGLNLSLVALSGGVLMSIFSGEEPNIMGEIDWSTIFFLAGLFILINGLDKIGIIEILSDGISSFIKGLSLNMPISIMWLMAIPSSVIDNVPMTAAFAPVVRDWVLGGEAKSTWWGLVIGANLGGCLTPIGTPSNIVALGIAEREGQPISMGRFFRLCIGVTLLLLIISTLYMFLLYSVL